MKISSSPFVSEKAILLAWMFLPLRRWRPFLIVPKFDSFAVATAATVVLVLVL